MTEVVYYPEVSPEVGKEMLADFVMAAWRKYSIVDDGGRK